MPTAWITCSATPTSPASPPAATTPNSCSASLRVFKHDGRLVVGIDRRGVVALESFVMARYMMFASVYFHHTTRMFEHMLHDVLRELWPDPRALDRDRRVSRWDDFRVLNALDDSRSEAAYALRNRVRVYALAAEFNAERDLTRLRGLRSGTARALRRKQRLGGLAVATAAPPPAGNRAARDRSGGRRRAVRRCARSLRRHRQTQRKAYWRKLFVRRSAPAASDDRITRGTPHLPGGRRRLVDDADCRLSGR